MASNVVEFPIGKTGPFLETVDFYLDACYPNFTEDERATLKARLVDVVNRYKVPWGNVAVPTEALASAEHAPMISRAIEQQLYPVVQNVFGGMLTEILFHHCYSYSLERELQKKEP